MELDADSLACATWSYLVEPGDGIHHEIFAEIGPAAALEQLRKDKPLPLPAQSDATLLQRSRERWQTRLQVANAQADLDLIEALGGAFIPFTDTRFPESLNRLGANRPVGLWCRGEKLLPDRPVIAIVGARTATPHGMEMAAELAQGVAGEFAVVSGGAYGIDYAAHRGCLSMAAENWAVLAGGVDRPYPEAHNELFTNIMRVGGLLSELPPGARPSRWRFLYRNRVIAGLAAAIVVVEAGLRSGALATARHGLALGVNVGAVPGRPTDVMSAGCNAILRQDVTLISNCEQLRELARDACAGLFSSTQLLQTVSEDSIGERTAQSPENNQPQLNAAEERVYQALPLTRKSAADKLAQAAGMSFRETQRVLYSLKQRQLVEQHGQFWRRKHD